MSGASASVPRPRVDAEPSVSNNNIQENSETPDNWQIGIPRKDFNVHHSVLYTHGYYKKVQLGDSDTRAKCMMCWIENRKETLVKITNNSPKGLLI